MTLTKFHGCIRLPNLRSLHSRFETSFYVGNIFQVTEKLDSGYELPSGRFGI